MIALIDYGAGNITSVRKALDHLGADVRIARRPDDSYHASAVVVPGVGHFEATTTIDATWRQILRGGVEAGRPLLGICLGMQWLFEGSDEAPAAPGLGLLAGRCHRLSDAARKVPHVGWNGVTVRRSSWLLHGVPHPAFAYFTHAYAAPVTPDAVATTTYGETFSAVVECGVTAGVQFHPEKSGDVGLTVLANFIRFAEAAASSSRVR